MQTYRIRAVFRIGQRTHVYRKKIPADNPVFAMNAVITYVVVMGGTIDDILSVSIRKARF